MLTAWCVLPWPQRRWWWPWWRRTAERRNGYFIMIYISFISIFTIQLLLLDSRFQQPATFYCISQPNLERIEEPCLSRFLANGTIDFHMVYVICKIQINQIEMFQSTSNFEK